jgi:hypothetical protein
MAEVFFTSEEYAINVDRMIWEEAHGRDRISSTEEMDRNYQDHHYTDKVCTGGGAEAEELKQAFQNQVGFQSRARKRKRELLSGQGPEIRDASPPPPPPYLGPPYLGPPYLPPPYLPPPPLGAPWPCFVNSDGVDYPVSRARNRRNRAAYQAQHARDREAAMRNRLRGLFLAAPPLPPTEVEPSSLLVQTATPALPAPAEPAAATCDVPRPPLSVLWIPWVPPRGHASPGNVMDASARATFLRIRAATDSSITWMHPGWYRYQNVHLRVRMEDIDGARVPSDEHLEELRYCTLLLHGGLSDGATAQARTQGRLMDRWRPSVCAAANQVALFDLVHQLVWDAPQPPPFDVLPASRDVLPSRELGAQVQPCEDST